MKRFLLTGILILQTFTAFAQSATLEVYEELYNGTPTWQGKLAILQEMTAENIDGSVDFYAKAFNDLMLTYRSLKHGSTEWASANNITHILIAELVSAGYEAAGDNLWRCYQVSTDPIVQAKALVALGELKIESHYADVEQTVRWLNANSEPANRQNDEIIAAGGFTALEKYGKPEGYLAAFIGLESWYREFVKQSARSAVTALLQDPALLLPDIIMSAQYTPLLKQKALLYVDGSSLDISQKADIASRSLLQGWLSYSSNQRIAQELMDLRRIALQMIRKYGSNGAKETYSAVDRSLREGALDEKIDSILVLGVLKTPESTNILIDYAQTLNESRRIANSLPIDDRLMRLLVPAMSTSSDPRVQDTLRQIQAVPWSNTVLNLVREALAKLG
ncbi:MAG: hypothetical protein LBG27_07350 [Spirochaetaceae bacterium]|jgi:hypothetical protein|nr:hypothetical protein [Spirochaetaceae bacterium]